MSTLLEIEAATEALPPEQQEELLRFLSGRLRPLGPGTPSQRDLPVLPVNPHQVKQPLTPQNSVPHFRSCDLRVQRSRFNDLTVQRFNASPFPLSAFRFCSLPFALGDSTI